MTWKTARVLIAVLFAGCAADVESASSTSAPIVNGELGGDPAVVVLQNYRSGGLCTGALIAERVVLTAKHCVQEAFEEGPVSPSSMVVGVGDNVRRISSSLRVQSISTTPGVYTTDSRGGIGSGLVGEDVAVMVLQTGVPGLEPLPIRRESPSGLSGQTITAVGFGQTPDGQVGVKYTTTGRVNGVSGDLIYVGPITCQGDSGGPAITSDGQIAGVVSFGAGSCGSGYGAYNAIFNYLDLIDGALLEAGSCLNDGEERCDGADNDCDDMVDETCTPIGGACANDDECVGTTCRDTPGGRLCTAPCDPLRPEFGCEAGSYCARSSGCEGFCVPLPGGMPGTLGNDADCTRDDECASLFCADPGDGRRRCLSPCRGDAGMCLAGEACAALPGACGACVAEAILADVRGLGESCEEADECRSSICYEDGGRSYCSRTCEADADCGTGYHCRASSDVSMSRCAAGPRGDIGDPCLGNGDCASLTFCAMRLDQAWCTRQCSDDDPCPEGFSCIAAGGTSVCAPDRGLVGDACAGDAECISGVCSDDGICTRSCGPDAPCAVGLECQRVGDSGDAVCAAPSEPPVAGGCAVAPEARSHAAWLCLAGLALAWLARRRRA